MEWGLNTYTVKCDILVCLRFAFTFRWQNRSIKNQDKNIPKYSKSSQKSHFCNIFTWSEQGYLAVTIFLLIGAQHSQYNEQFFYIQCHYKQMYMENNNICKKNGMKHDLWGQQKWFTRTWHLYQVFPMVNENQNWDQKLQLIVSSQYRQIPIAQKETSTYETMKWALRNSSFNDLQHTYCTTY